jgi:hypothetical protein
MKLIILCLMLASAGFARPAKHHYRHFIGHGLGRIGHGVSVAVKTVV